MGTTDLLFITLSQNVPFTGKTWWVLMLSLRLLVELLAGFTLFSDEQEKFICNTIQPGCSNVCFDIFSPVSLLRFWLLHLILLFLPHAVFATYVMHRLIQIHRSQGASHERELSLHKTQLTTPGFYCSYLLVVFVRILVEMAFGASQFFLFGLSVPKSFLCYEAPCTSGVECYISKPTEKTLMLNFTLGVTALSILVSLVDMVTSMKAMVRWRRKRDWLTEEISKGEQGSVFTMTTLPEDSDGLLGRRMTPGGGSGEEKQNHQNKETDNSAPALESTASTNEKTQENLSPPPFPPSPLPTPLVLHRHMKPPLYPRPDCRPPPLILRVPTPPGGRQLDQSCPVGTGSDSSDSQDRRAWV